MVASRALPWRAFCVLVLAAIPASAAPDTLALYGELYDVSSIDSWHPGGAAILRQVRSLQVADATPMFESFHSLRDADEMKAKLAHLPRAAASAPPQLYTFSEDGFYRTVRKRVAAFVRETSDTPPVDKTAAPKGGARIVLKYAALAAFAIVCFVVGVRAEPSVVGLATTSCASFIGGLALAAATFCLLHDASHFGAFTRDVEATTFASRFTQASLGWDHAIWRVHHVLQHHTYTGDNVRDPDVRHGGGIFCKVKEGYLCDPAAPIAQFLHTLQIMNTGQVLEYLILKTLGYRSPDPSGKSGGLPSLRGVLFERWAWWQYPVAAALPLGYPVALYAGARGAGASRGMAAARILVGLTLASSGLNLGYSMNILIDHDSEASVQSFNELAVKRGAGAPDWGEVQVRASANWGGRIWCFFFGGINYQIEHHLFPTIYHGWLPQLAPIVRATCEEFGVPYTSFDSVASGLLSVLTQYRAAAANAEMSRSSGKLGDRVVRVVAGAFGLWGWTFVLLAVGCGGSRTVAAAVRKAGGVAGRRGIEVELPLKCA